MLPIFQRKLDNNRGDVLPGALFTMTDWYDDTATTLWADENATTEKGSGGVMNANVNGEVLFYHPPGVWNIAIEKGDYSATFNKFIIHDQEIIINDSTTSRLLTLPDSGNIIRFTNGSAISVEVPADAVTKFQIGSRVHIRQAGAGAITFSGGTGVTINAPADGTLVSAGQGAMLALIKVAANTWDLIGHTVAA